MSSTERELAPDWILQQTLGVQTKAFQDWANGKNAGKGLTMTVLGCGTMGIAILGGILDSLTSSPEAASSMPTPPGADAPTESPPSRLPGKFNACVRSSKSAKRISNELGKYQGDLTVYENENLKPTQEADVILIGCKPQMVEGILKAEGMKEAVAGKLLLSICAGVPGEQIRGVLYGDTVPEGGATIVRAMPNTAAAVRESMTVVATSTPPLPAETSSLITWIFSRIGRVTYLPPNTMDACTALCGSGPAFAALMLESMAAGAVAMGVPRDDAYMMAAQTMRGTTGLVLEGGEHPAIVRDKVTTPGGCTIGGLLVLEEGSVRGTVSRAVREATVVASQLGQGKQGVNGTRH